MKTKNFLPEINCTVINICIDKNWLSVSGTHGVYKYKEPNTDPFDPEYNYTDFDLTTDYKLLFDLSLHFGITVQLENDSYVCSWKQDFDEFCQPINREIRSGSHVTCILMAIIAQNEGNFDIKISLDLLKEITECISTCDLDPKEAFIYALEAITTEDK